MPDEIRQRQRRRRGAELDEAVFAAVRAELDEHGYFGLTREGVARRASTSKPVLYRRWSTRGEMVVATLWHERTSFPATPDTGTLAGDMKALLQNMSSWITRVGRDVVLGLIAELPPDTTAEILGDSDPQRLAFIDELVDRARGRGELGPGALPDGVRRAPLTLARYHAIVFGQLDRETIDEIVDDVFVPVVRSILEPK